jgi:hypothetical protein
MTVSMATHGHRQAVEASVQAMASLLSELLSRRMTAFVVGVDNVKTVSRWISGEVTQIRDPAVETRLRAAFEIATMLMQVDSPEVVRAWFISLNPQLGDATPVAVIHNGQSEELKEVISAARAFATGG